MTSSDLQPALPGTRPRCRSFAVVFLSDAAIGILGGMMGLGGAELRLPLLIGLLGFAARPAITIVSLPTMLVAFTRYSRNNSFTVLGETKGFLIAMTAGSITGTIARGLLLGVVPSIILIPLLVLMLIYQGLASQIAGPPAPSTAPVEARPNQLHRAVASQIVQRLVAQ